MNKKTLLLSVITTILTTILVADSVLASNLIREQRLRDEIVDNLMDGDAIFLKLKKSKHEFLSIYTKAENEKGVVILLHGRGFHPNWPDLIQPVRVALVESGWSTLAIQLPVLEKTAKYYDYVPIFPEADFRIDAALAYAKQRLNHQPSKTILLAHSCGAHMAMHWLRQKIKNKQSVPIDGYIGLGMGATDYKQPMLKPFVLDKLNVPILDIYAEQDFNAVIKMAKVRLEMIKKAGDKKSKQMMIKNSNHYYADRDDAVVQMIVPWLDGL